MKRIYCKIEKCLACRSCEIACALAHSEYETLVDTLRDQKGVKPRVHVQFVDEEGTLRKVRALAIQCRHCDEPLCAQACISGGIKKDEETGEIIVRLDKCVGCWSCIMVCPTGAISKNENMHQALKCDNCPDKEIPSCIVACPTHALIQEEYDSPQNHEN